MAIENVQAVRFCNEQARVFADALASAYWTAKAMVANYYSDPDLGTAFTNGIAETISDGAVIDGRPIITGNDALGIITRASELIADLEAGNNAKLNTVLALAVNGRSRIGG